MNKRTKATQKDETLHYAAKRRAIIYPRRSGEKDDDKYTLDTQREASQQYAKQRGLEVIFDKAEEQTGTIHLRDRRVGAEVWRLLKEKQASVLIVYAADRLTRANLMEALPMIGELLKMGVEIHTLDHGIIDDPNNIGTIIRIWQSSDERRKIVERTQRGRLRKAQSGKLVGMGRAPFWLDRIGVGRTTDYRINPERVKVVRKIVEWYLGKNGKAPIGMVAITKRLTASGVPAPGGQALWHRVTLQRLLKNSNLYGVFTYGSILIERPDLAVIDRATFERIQAQCAKNTQFARRNMKHDYLLSGRMHCACGLAMGSQPNTQRSRHGSARFFYFDYRCRSHVLPPRADHPCTGRRITADRADELVWNFLRKRLSPEYLAKSIAYLKAKQATPQIEQQEAIDIGARLDVLQRKIERLLNEFGESTDAKLAADAKHQIELARYEQDALQVRQVKLGVDLTRAAVQQSDRAELANKLSDLAARIDGATFEARRVMLDILAVAVQLVIDEQGNWKLRVSSAIAAPEELLYRAAK